MSIVLLATVALSGCYYDNEEVLYPAGFCDLANATWTNTIQPIIATQCAIPGCHVQGGNGPGDFTGYSGLKTAVDNGKFEQKVLEQRSMPPSGPLSDCELQQIATWLQAGALEN